MSFIAENPLLLAEVEGIPRTPFGGTRGIYAGKDGFYVIDDEGNVDKVVAGKDITEIIDNLNSLYYYGDMNIKPSDSSLFKFAINEDDETASVIGLQNSADSIDELEYLAIPYEYTDENKKTYRITTIGDGELGGINFNTFSTIIIPNSVIDIKQWSFSACKKIKKIIFSDNITSIGINAFSTCDGLTDIILPNNLTAISIGVFDTCGNLTSVTISNSVTKIESGAFFQCDNLTDVYFKGTKEQWESITIENDNEPLFNATIHYNWCDGSSGSGGSSEGEENVQSDWNEADETSDAFIKNKPVFNLGDLQFDAGYNSIEEAFNDKLDNGLYYFSLNNESKLVVVSKQIGMSIDITTQTLLPDCKSRMYLTEDETPDTEWHWTDWEGIHAGKLHHHSYEDLTDKPTIPVVEQSYDAKSENAQSGKAVAEALNNIPKEIIDLGDLTARDDYIEMEPYDLNEYFSLENFLNSNAIYKYELGEGITTGGYLINIRSATEDYEANMQFLLDGKSKEIKFRRQIEVWNADTHQFDLEFMQFAPLIPSVDQTYQPTSVNAQSGNAVAEAIKSNTFYVTVDIKEEDNSVSNISATFEEIIKAHNDGKSVIMIANRMTSDGFPNTLVAPLKDVEDFFVVFSCVFNLNVFDIILFEDSTWWYNRTQLSTSNDIENLLSTKVDKESGKGLSSNNFTNEEKEKLENINSDFIITGNASYDEETSTFYLSDMSHTYDDLRSAYNDGKNLKVNLANYDSYYEASLTSVCELEGVHGYFEFASSVASFVISKARCDRAGWSVITEFLVDEEGLYDKVDKIEYERFKDDLESGMFIVNSSFSSDYSGYADYALYDYDQNDIRETYATKEELRPTPRATVTDTLFPNQPYHLSEPPSKIAFPSADVADGDTIYLTFMTGDTPPTIEFYTTNTTEIDIEIEANTGYEIYGKYFEHIGKWIVGYSEYTITEDEAI